MLGWNDGVILFFFVLKDMIFLYLHYQKSSHNIRNEVHFYDKFPGFLNYVLQNENIIDAKSSNAKLDCPSGSSKLIFFHYSVIIF